MKNHLTRATICWTLLACVTASPPAIAAGSFKDVPIIIGVLDGNTNSGALVSPAFAHAKTWAEKTGGKPAVVKIPFDHMFRRYMNGISSDTPEFDVIIYAPAWAGDFAPFMSPVPEELMNDEAFDDIHDTYRDRLMKWGDKWIAVTIDGDLFCGYYRKDLFHDPANARAFREKYGRSLLPPDTWKQYRDIAEFFTGRKGPDGKTLAGAVEVFGEGGQRFWFLFCRAAAYANHPDQPGGQFFDPETMKARINSPAWVRAVEDYAAIQAFAPPNSADNTLGDIRKAFSDGRAAMTMEWGDTGQITAEAAGSKVAGKVGFFMLPGSRKVWNPKTAKWDKFATPRKVPFLAFGGWVAGVPKNSAHKAAAWDYIMWYGNPENSLKDVVTSGTGINPYRFSHFMNIDAWTKAFSQESASEYLGVLRMSLDSPNAALDLRIPGFHEYTDALEKGLTPALKKEMSAQAAMDRIAARWEKITDKYGRKKQLAVYRASMGLDK